jgi:hypothetical protein
MRSVAATIRFDVRGEGGVTVFVNIEGGRSSAGDAPAHPPFLSIAVDRSHYEPLFREAGDNVLGFLGGISGMGAPIKLTRDRVEQIAAVGGTLCFELTGKGGFQLLAKLGDAAPGDNPDTTIRVDAQAYRELREAGSSQEAFSPEDRPRATCSAPCSCARSAVAGLSRLLASTTVASAMRVLMTIRPSAAASAQCAAERAPSPGAERRRLRAEACPMKDELFATSAGAIGDSSSAPRPRRSSTTCCCARFRTTRRRSA